MASTEPTTNSLEDPLADLLPPVDVELSDRSPPTTDRPPKFDAAEAEPCDSAHPSDIKSRGDPTVRASSEEHPTHTHEQHAKRQPAAHDEKSVTDGPQCESSTDRLMTGNAPRVVPESARSVRTSEDATMEDRAGPVTQTVAAREVQRTETTRQPSPRLDLPIVPISNDKVEISEDAPIGEWRRVEDIITIVRGEDGVLTIIMDSAQQPLELVRMEDNQWQARRMGSMDVIYDLTLRTKDTFEVRKDSRCCKIFRIKRSRTLLGDWSNPKGKGLSVFDAGRDYEIRAEGRPILKLVRKKILDWEARRADNGVVVYLLEHAENSHRLVVRRPDAGPHGPPPLELTRSDGWAPGHARDTPAPPLPPPLPPPLALPLPPPPDRAPPPSPPPRRRGSPRGRGAEAGPPSPTTHAKDYEEFTVGNSLSGRVCEAMSKLPAREQRHVMGLDGGRNSFHLTGMVRDPSSVVMSRIRRLEREPLPSEGPGPESRSRSRWRHRSRSSSGKGSSSSSSYSRSRSGEKHGSRSRSRPRR